MKAARAGGWSLVAASLGFTAVFLYLAARFNYPDVLDGEAFEVLPRLLELGGTGRAVWALYACLPLLLVPAGVGAYAAWNRNAPHAMHAAVIFASVAAFSMMLGLARWPTVNWELARAFVAEPAAHPAIDAVFAGLNVFLGNFVGEFVGEIALNAFFVLTGYAALHSRDAGRWFGWAGMMIGLSGWIGAFRNVTNIVAPVTEMNNYLLAVWLMTMGIILIRWQGSDTSTHLREFGIGQDDAGEADRSARADRASRSGPARVGAAGDTKGSERKRG